jgi:hypothetical protein
VSDPTPPPDPLPPGQLPSTVDGPSVLVRVETPRRPRRWPWVVGSLGVTALVVTGAVALAAGDGGGYSLEVAIDGAGDHESVTSELEVDMAMIEMTASGATDFVDELATADVEFGVGEMSMVMDLGEEAFYLQADALGQNGRMLGGAEWIRFSAADLEALGLGPADLSGGVGTAAGDLGPLFDAFGDAVEVEEGEIETLDDLDGIRAKHYTVVIDTEQLTDALALSLDQLGLGRRALPDTVDVDVWVDGDDLIRRLELELDLGMTGMDMVVRYPSWDEDLDLELPDPDTVVDASDLPGMFR